MKTVAMQKGDFVTCTCRNDEIGKVFKVTNIGSRFWPRGGGLNPHPTLGGTDNRWHYVIHVKKATWNEVASAAKIVAKETVKGTEERIQTLLANPNPTLDKVLRPAGWVTCSSEGAIRSKQTPPKIPQEFMRAGLAWGWYRDELFVYVSEMALMKRIPEKIVGCKVTKRYVGQIRPAI